METEEDFCEDNIYSKENVENLMDNDELTGSEAGFMIGYLDSQ